MKPLNRWSTILGAVAILGIMVSYGIYAFTNPHINGMVFASVLGMIGAITGGILGFNIGWFRRPPDD